MVSQIRLYIKIEHKFGANRALLPHPVLRFLALCRYYCCQSFPGSVVIAWLSVIQVNAEIDAWGGYLSYIKASSRFPQIKASRALRDKCRLSAMNQECTPYNLAGRPHLTRKRPEQVFADWVASATPVHRSIWPEIVSARPARDFVYQDRRTGAQSVVQSVNQFTYRACKAI